jgi:hypothetical protein
MRSRITLRSIKLFKLSSGWLANVVADRSRGHVFLFVVCRVFGRRSVFELFHQLDDVQPRAAGDRVLERKALAVRLREAVVVCAGQS